MKPPPHSIEHEEYVLGAILLTPSALPLVVVDEGLRPEHFYRERSAAVYRAMLALFDQHEPIDFATVLAEVERGDYPWQSDHKPWLGGLSGEVPAVSNVQAYASRVVELAVLRDKRAALLGGLEAVAAEDQGKLAGAEAKLSAAGRDSNASASPEQLAHELWEHLEADEVEAFPFPFEQLNRLTLGGMKRGGVTLLGGWSGFGKTAMLDQSLEGIAKRARVHLYINEMTRLERGLRFLQRRTGIDPRRLALSKLDADDMKRAVSALKDIPFGITDVAGWSVEEIGFDIRRNRWDAAGIDILHLIDYEDEADMRRISRVINRTAKQARCHILATVHLSEPQTRGGRLPFPVVQNIKAASALRQDADNILFVHREQSKDGTKLLPESKVYLAKVRTGETGGLDAIFKGRRVRFDLGTLQSVAA